MSHVWSNKQHQFLWLLNIVKHVGVRGSTSALTAATGLEQVNELLSDWVLTSCRGHLKWCGGSTFQVLEVNAPWSMDTLGVFAPLIIHVLGINWTSSAQETLLGACLLKDLGASEHAEVVAHQHCSRSKCSVAVGWCRIVQCESSEFSRSLKILLI